MSVRASGTVLLEEGQESGGGTQLDIGQGGRAVGARTGNWPKTASGRWAEVRRSPEPIESLWNVQKSGEGAESPN